MEVEKVLAKNGLQRQAKPTLWFEDFPVIRVKKAEMIDLDAHWSFIRQKLAELREKYEIQAPLVPLRWEPEHFLFEIRKHLQGGFQASGVELFLALGIEEGETEETLQGFFITTLQYDSFLHIPLDFHVWIACAWRKYVLEAALLQGDRIAMDRGCTAIEHMSPFLGWKRRQEMMMRKLRTVYGLEAGNEWRLKYVIWRRSLVGED